MFFTSKWIAVMPVTLILIIALSFGIWIATSTNLEFESDVQKTDGAIVANGIECPGIGKLILQINGSAADAAIATLFCECVTSPQSMGLGGGFLLTIYERATKKTETLIARETAPKASDKNMFANVTQVTGAKSIAVFGDLKGYWELHQKYGKLNWSTLVQPSIDLCRTGFTVTAFLGRSLEGKKNIIMNSPGLRETFVNPATKDVYKAWEKIKNPQLAESLEIIAKEGANSLYGNGTLAKRIISELNSLGGIMTMDDLLTYQIVWNEPEIARFSDGNILYSVPLPGSGSLLTFMINVLDGFLTGNLSVTQHQRLIETFKYAYAKRTFLGDPMFAPESKEIVAKLRDLAYAMEVRKNITDERTFQDYEHYGANYSNPEDHGTAHVSVLAPNGDAVSITSTINTIFGSKILSQTTGIIFNDQMDDFSTPNLTNAFGLHASPANFIAPGKRPLSSMCPSIIVDKNGDVQLVIGAAGGSKITSSIIYVIAKHFWFGESLIAAINSKRIHHQLAPMAIESEYDFDKDVLAELQKIGHKIIQIPPEDGFAAVSGISRRNGKIEAVYDVRRNGSFVLI